MNRRGPSPAIGVVLALIGGAILVFGTSILGLVGLPTQAPTGSTVSGTVVATPTVDDSCSPVAEYEVDGETYTVESSIATGPCAWTIGQPIDVTYPPADPARGQISSDFETGQLVQRIFVGLGAAMVVVGLALLAWSIVVRLRNR